MKKILLSFLSLTSLVFLCGCEEDEDYLSYLSPYHHGETTAWGTRVKDPEPTNPYPLYVFPALKKGQPDFALHLTNAWNFNNWTEYEAAPGYSNRFIVVAIYSLACTDCYAHAPYFDKLAKEFENTPLEFAILFMDDDREAITNLDWVHHLQNVNVYYNSENFCNKGLCIQSNGVIMRWVADSKVNQPGSVGFPTSEEDVKSHGTPEDVYQQYVQRTQQFMDSQKTELVDITNQEMPY